MVAISANPLLQLGLLLPRDSRDSGSWLPEGAHIFTPNGRSALLAALRALDVPAGGGVLLPAYLCESVVEPVRAHGAVPVFYPVSRSLEPDADAVESLLRGPKASVLVVIHYFGFPAPAWHELSQLATARGVPVVEDCAHALYSRNGDQLLGSSGQAAIFSLRKSLPVPQGGILVLRAPNEAMSAPPVHWQWQELGQLTRELAYRLDRGVGLSLRSRILAGDQVLAWARRRDRAAPLAPEAGIGPISRHIAGGVDAAEVAARRRHNFLWLRDALEEFQERAVPLLPELPDGVCPLGFPILLEERDAMRRALARRGIGVRMFWDELPGELPVQDFPDSTYLRDRILVLPIHQDMEDRHLDCLVDAMRAVWSAA